MSRMNIPYEALTSRFNLQGRFDSVRSQGLGSRFANLKPIGEFLDLKRLSKPQNFGEVQTRVNYNLSYFSSNYLVVFVMLSIYSLLTNLVLLFDLVLVVVGLFGIGKLGGADLDLGFARATSSQLYTGLWVIAIPLGIWASPITTALWLIGASGHLSLRKRSRWSAAPSSPYDTGRPPGVTPGGGGRRSLRPQEWELREPARHYGERFEDMESDEDDGQGVYLDPNGYAYRDPRQRSAYAGDELYFTGHDMGQHRRGSYPNNAYYGEGESEEEYAYQQQQQQQQQQSYNGRDEALAQAAYERIAKARASGQTNINLSVDEMEAIERRRAVQQLAPVQQPPPLQIASPPATPVKTPKGKSSSSRNNSSVSLSSTKGKKKSSSLFGGGGGPSTPPSKSKSKSKSSSRKMSISSDQPPPFSPPALPPPHGYMIPAPNWPAARATAHAQLPNTTAAVPRPRNPFSPPSPYPTRFYPGAPPNLRPNSSSSNRSFHDDPPPAEWYPPPPQPSGRSRAGSNAAHAYRDDYAGPPMPAAQGRRSMGGNGGNMADVNFSSLRRVPPGSSPLAGSAQYYYGAADPQTRKGSGLSQEVDSGSSSSGSGSEDQGVQVEVIPEREVKAKTAVKGSGSASADARRRKGRR
ncbi:hypothetical protein Q7P37_002997 [Cladosporium fusiforme]